MAIPTVKEIDRLEQMFRHGMQVLQEGLQECARWREGLEGGTPPTPKIKKENPAVTRALKNRRKVIPR